MLQINYTRTGIYGAAYGFKASTGAEIGIYYRKNYYPYGWYKCAPNEDCLLMSYSLYSGNTKLFYRSSTEYDNYNYRHWWLTGFKPGVGIKPKNLTMKSVTIYLKSVKMAEAFENSLRKASGNKGTGKATNIHRYKDIVMFNW